jgi:hypothetical protein
VETTVCDIWNNRDKLINYDICTDLTNGLSKQKAMKPSTYKELDRAMLEWLKQQRKEGTTVSRIICTKWNFFMHL